MTFLQTFHPSRTVRWLAAAALVMTFLFLTGCDQTGDMLVQPRYDTLGSSDLFADGQAARQPVPGTVPYAAEGSINSPELTGQSESGEPLENFPVELNAEMLQHGQEQYNIYCVPCHGPAGEGNGRVVQYGFAKPPSLLADNAKNMTNGDMFTIIRDGRGNMFPYGYRVKAPERWAIIAFVRALQMQNGPVNARDLTPEQIEQLGNQP